MLCDSYEDYGTELELFSHDETVAKFNKSRIAGYIIDEELDDEDYGLGD